MTLTEHLDDPGSPVRAFLDQISPRLSVVRGRSAAALAAADAIGLVDVANCSLAVRPFENVDAVRVGTAVDIRARVAMDGFDVRSSSAAQGVTQLRMLAHQVENGAHRARVLEEAFCVAVGLLDAPSSEADLDRAALLLAPCEQVFRGGPKTLAGSVGDACDQAIDGQAFAEQLDPLALADIRSLMQANSEQIQLWRERIASGERFNPNPSFAGSTLVGGADGDWLVGETLIDCKVYGSLTVPTLRDFLRQMLGYVMLDLDDALGIRQVGIWLPRQRLTPTWSLTRLLGGDPEELLAPLREGFARAAGGQQLTPRIPVPERRGQQLLADNRHTPYAWLSDLAGLDDVDIRFRVGRNAVAPQDTIRTLATDRFARVREGVAMNELAPGDVLEALTRDPSVAVRRAVAANPGAPRPLLKALTSDVDRDVRWAARANDGVLLVGGPDTLELATRVAPAGDLVPVSQGRDESALDTMWFSNFLAVAQGEQSRWPARLPIPLASRIWGAQSGRVLDVPGWFKAGLPAEVKADLMREGRPAWVRRRVASVLPISTPAVQRALLNDTDPEIRWDALERSADHPDAGTEALLGELAISRSARVRFRTAGNDDPSWARPLAPSEYEQQTLQLVAAHPSTPSDALRSLMQATSPAVLANLIANPSLDADDRDALVGRMLASKSIALRVALAASRMIPADVSEQMTSDRNTKVRKALAGNSAVSETVLLRLSESPELSIRRTVLENPKSSAELASTLAAALLSKARDSALHAALQALDGRDDLQLPEGTIADALDRLSKSRERDPDLRSVAANDERTGSRTLKRLAMSADPDIREAVAGNARTPLSVLSALANDADSDVRAAVASNSASDESLLAALARDEQWHVRKCSAGNPTLPHEALRELLLDDDPRVRTAAFDHPSTSVEMVRRAEVALAADAPDASGTSHADLVEMAADKRAEVRMQVAYSPQATHDLLAFLGGERRSARVRRVVAANPNTPTEVLRSLADDEDAEVRHAVAFSGATPASLLAELAARGIDLALLVALNPDTPIEVLDALAEDSNPLISFVAYGARSGRAETGDGSGRELAAFEGFDAKSIGES